MDYGDREVLLLLITCSYYIFLSHLIIFCPLLVVIYTFSLLLIYFVLLSHTPLNMILSPKISLFLLFIYSKFCLLIPLSPFSHPNSLTYFKSTDQSNKSNPKMIKYQVKIIANSTKWNSNQ